MARRAKLDQTSATAISLGLPADVVGKTVTIYGRELTVVGFVTSRYKYPVSVSGPQSGKYKLGVAQVLAALGGASPVATAAQVAPAVRPQVGKRFRTGNRVRFTAKGQTVTGTVKRVNMISVTVVPDVPKYPGQYWRVSPAFLEAV